MASNNQQQLKVENLKHEEFKKFHEAVFEKTLRVRESLELAAKLSPKKKKTMKKLNYLEKIQMIKCRFLGYNLVFDSLL